MCTKIKGIFVPGAISLLTVTLLIISAQTKYKEMLESLYEHLLLSLGLFFMLLYITIGNPRLIKKESFLISLIVFITMATTELMFFELPETTKVIMIRENNKQQVKLVKRILEKIDSFVYFDSRKKG